jgi:hypothetical protein
LHDKLKLHLRQEPDGTLYGITSAGQRFIKLLQLNRPPLVLYRLNAQRAEQSAERYRTIDDRLEQIMARIQRVEEQIRSRRR